MLFPQQNDCRNTLDLSGFWSFKLDPNEVGETENWFNGLTDARQIAVPASWNEQFEDTRDYLGMAWYVQTTFVPSNWKGQRIFLRVGSANYAAKVWVNGHLVGEHLGGHLPFSFEISEQLNWQAENMVAISVENHLKPTRVPPGNVQGGAMSTMMGSYPSANFDFFPYAGLHRPVSLFALPKTHIEDVTVVTDLEQSTGIVNVTVKQANGNLEGKVKLEGEGVGLESKLTFSEGEATANFSIPDARLWSPHDPYLYKLDITLSDGGETVDRYDLDIGIRTVEVRGKELLLNGEPIFLKGFGKHEDFPIHGRGLNRPLLVRDNSLFKWLGANSYRTAHYPYSEEALQLADREGILIIDETPAVGLFFEDGPENIATRLEQCKTQLSTLIARDKNHPSVIMWSVANEPFPPHMIQRFMGGEVPPLDPATTDFFKELFEVARTQDPSRLATVVGIHGCPTEWLELSDVIFINRYYGWYSEAGQIEVGKEKLADEVDALFNQLQKPIVISEFGTDTVAGSHSNPPEMFTEEYQVEFLRAYLDVADERDFMVGMHVWNFADFKTGQGTRRVNGLNLKGVFTRDRRPKMAAHFLRERWFEEAK